MSAETPDISGIYDYLEGLTDPRVERTRLHALEDIIILALIAGRTTERLAPIRPATWQRRAHRHRRQDA
jgi:hypothetical protein